MHEDKVTTMPDTTTRHLRVAIIGAGMSGIAAAIKLAEQGYRNIVIFEKVARLGGTWRDNTYPGLSCDVPSHLYAYEFEPNPDWSHLFSPGGEIQAYFERVAGKYGVDRLMQFNKEVTCADFLDNQWHLSMADGDRWTGDVVIAATGVLHQPAYPDIDGIEDFGGACFHSARWDHSVSLDNRRVGIVGTGSTAMQIVPAIVERVASLSLFQRTAQWVIDMSNVPYSDEERAAFRQSPEKMKAVYDHWAHRFNYRFGRAVIGDKVEIDRIARLCQANLDNNVHDPELKKQLTPDYVATCKRLIMSDTFYPAIQRSNANLVTAGIERFEKQGIRAQDGNLHEFDVIVLATGFDAHAFVRPMQIRGANGATLKQEWAASNVTHRSIMIPDMPNFFMLIGPNSPVGNFPLILVAERQLAYISQLLAPVQAGECRAIAPRRAATEQFQRDVRDAMKDTVWMSGCSSWYLDKNGVPVTWPWDFDRFEQDMKAPVFSEYELIA